MFYISAQRTSVERYKMIYLYLSLSVTFIIELEFEIHGNILSCMSTYVSHNRVIFRKLRITTSLGTYC